MRRHTKGNGLLWYHGRPKVFQRRAVRNIVGPSGIHQIDIHHRHIYVPRKRANTEPKNRPLPNTRRRLLTLLGPSVLGLSNIRLYWRQFYNTTDTNSRLGRTCQTLWTLYGLLTGYHRFLGVQNTNQVIGNRTFQQPLHIIRWQRFIANATGGLQWHWVVSTRIQILVLTFFADTSLVAFDDKLRSPLYRRGYWPTFRRNLPTQLSDR